MKRDLDLFRLILLEVEKRLPEERAVQELEIDGYSVENVAYHVMLLVDSGYLEGIDTSHLQSFCTEYAIRWLTAAGHDYLDQIRNPEVWRKTKNVADKAGGFSLDLIKDIAKGIIVTQIKKHSGVEIEA